jgi:polar amino acid transport system substrate-binding protein
MPRGSKPGERRGGRQKGTPNKRTALKRALTIATLDSAHISPLDLNLALMRNTSLALEYRVTAALEALPYVHARLRRRSTARRPAEKSQAHEHKADEHKADEHEENERCQPGADRRASTQIGPRVPTKRLVVDGESPDADITPLRFLQRVMWNPNAPAKLRIKITAKITPYVHYKPAGRPGEAEQIAASGRARAVVVKDQFGYDPELLKEMITDEIRLRLEQKEREVTGKVSPEEAKLIARIKQRQPIALAESYTDNDLEMDDARLRQLDSKRKSKQANSKFTAEEKAEYAHLRARVKIFSQSPRLGDLRPPPDRRVADLVQAGKLRVGLGLGSPALTMRDPVGGELRGPALELARALAEKIGIEVQTVEYPRPGNVLDDKETDAWHVTFLLSEPSRTAVADFSPPYLQSDLTYLVPAGSTIRTVADANRPGIRIAVSRGDAPERYLARVLTPAELVRNDNIARCIDLLRAGQADAYAAPRSVAMALAPQLPGARVLEDGFGAISYVAMVPKGHPGRLAYVSEFIEQAKASGLVQEIIDRFGLQGAEVAPPVRPVQRMHHRMRQM